MKYLQALDAYRDQRRQQFEKGDFTPFRLPTDIGAYLLIACYLIVSRRWAFSSRICVFLLIVLRAFFSIKNSRAAGPAISYLVGIANAWFILVAFNMLVILNPKQKLARKQQKRRVETNESDAALPQDQAVAGHYWERMPDSMGKRVFWVMDLLGSTRLIHWSSTYTSHSKRILQGPRPDYKFEDLSLSRLLLRILLIFLAVEVLKELVALDPYFWGQNAALEPAPQIHGTLAYTIVLTAYRQLVSVSLVFLALRILTTYGYLLFVCLFGTSIAGIWGEPSSWRPLHGSLRSIWTHGIIGFWGDVWHQMFRVMLTVPTTGLMEACGLQPQSTGAKLISLVLPFSISGVIHAYGSYTLSDMTHPLQSFIFFILQPLGIILQLVLAQLINRSFPINIATYCKGVVNIGSTLLWLMFTFSYFADDVARGGLFLAEPFPVGILHPFGTGSGRRWGNLWTSRGIEWYAGKHWWESGLAVG